MGSTGNSKSSNKYANNPTNDKNDLSGVTSFPDDTVLGNDKAIEAATKWFADDKMSNYIEWTDKLTTDEYDAIRFYTGSGYDELNKELYELSWDKMDDDLKSYASDLYEGINKFELNKAINITRATSASYVFEGTSKWVGENTVADAETIKKAIKENPYKQFNGFQSASTGAEPVFGGNLVIHYVIPPSKGAGAYVQPMSRHGSEREFVINSNAVVKFDPNSVRIDNEERIHVNAEWVGQAYDQHFDKKR